MSGSYLESVPHELCSDVRLWRVDLDAYAEAVALDGLSAGEHARAARMAPGQNGRRHLAARHALRRILGQALNRPPQSLVIEPDDWGKPRLRGPALEFSLSHSGLEALIGVSRDRAIGVDIEVVQEVVEAEALSRAHFTCAERAEWTSAGRAARDRTFLTCWTRKEACVKALGVGLSLRPECIEAGCTSDARVVAVHLGAQRCEVTLRSLRLPSESRAVAAVALAAPEAVRHAQALFRRT